MDNRQTLQVILESREDAQKVIALLKKEGLSENKVSVYSHSDKALPAKTKSKLRTLALYSLTLLAVFLIPPQFYLFFFAGWPLIKSSVFILGMALVQIVCALLLIKLSSEELSKMINSNKNFIAVKFNTSRSKVNKIKSSIVENCTSAEFLNN
jgi:hypothetical protein